MGLMITRGKELIRINPAKNAVEYSNNNGSNWYLRFAATSSMGTLQDLSDGGKDLLMTTSKGLYYSNNDGHNWYKR
jgi:hypothetical protein